MLGGLGLDVSVTVRPRYARKAQFDATARFDRTGRLSQIHAPVLILHGKSDHIAPVSATGTPVACDLER